MIENTKQQVREFYDQIGWSLIDDDLYQNARYEDLRPVSGRYIHRCHLRVARHLNPEGQFLLDAGSGPVQYPEYLEYSRSYQYRLCADISITALREARRRLGEHGLYVVMDIAALPFKNDSFDGIVSLHTIHHLPEDEHLQAYQELYRVLAPAGKAAVVNGWPDSQLMDFFEPLVRLSNRLRHRIQRLSSAEASPDGNTKSGGSGTDSKKSAGKRPSKTPKGTFTSRHDVEWIKSEVGGGMPVEIRVWRSVSVRFLRALIHPKLGGRLWLAVLFALEERFPHYFGERGKYPLIILTKYAGGSEKADV